MGDVSNRLAVDQQWKAVEVVNPITDRHEDGLDHVHGKPKGHSIINEGL